MKLKQLKIFTCGLLLLFMIGIVQKGKAQGCNDCGTITGFPSITQFGCIGDTYTQNWDFDGSTGYSFYNYTWSPSSGVTASSGTTVSATSIFIPTVCTTYTLSVNALSIINEVTDSNFDDGTIPTGFTTGYTLGDVSIEGNYEIGTNPSLINGHACSFHDYCCGGTGKMMICNGSSTYANILTGNFYLCCGSNYHFTFWATNWYDGFDADIHVTINGVLTDCSLVGVGCGSWQQFTIDFHVPETPCSGGVGNTSLTEIDFNTDRVGNDFAIDDISLRRICTSTQTLTLCPLADITGTTTICQGTSTTLFDVSTGGTWSSSNTLIATVGSSTGIVSGISYGTAIITYTLHPGCFTTTIVTVNPLPDDITGVFNVCVGMTTTLSDLSASGTWSSSNTLIATVGSSTGIVTGVSGGTAVITYSLTTGCFSTTVVTVNPLPDDIIGVMEFCQGTTSTFSDVIIGGTWSSSNTLIATVGSSTGIVTGVSGGTAVITYSLTTGCLTTANITIDPLPDAGVISGTLTICEGSITTLTDAITGGVWSSGNVGIATINTTGVVTGISAGTSDISYSVTNGCGTTVAIATVTVEPSPLPITGLNNICLGNSTTLLESYGNTWTSASTVIATVTSPGGVVTGVGLGTTIISCGVVYTVSTGLLWCYATYPITVNAVPDAITSTYSSLCSGTTITLSDATSGGAWSSSDATIASVNTGGVVTGGIPGIATITYTIGTGITACYVTKSITVNTAPDNITGLNEVCVGSSISLTDDIGGGSWSSSDITIATVNSSGLVTGVSTVGGVVTITYSIGTCFTTYSVTVNPLPSDILGPTAMCVGDVGTFGDVTSGGSWSCDVSSSIAIINITTGIVTAIGSGTVNITYTLTTGCFVTTVLTINPLPLPIDIHGDVCVGSTITLTDPTPGGVWDVGTGTYATFIGPDPTGLFLGVSAGTETISYSTEYCMVTTLLTVNPLPTISGGSTPVCVGNSITLSAGTGTWSTTSSNIATVGSGSDLIVTGVIGGMAVVTFTDGGTGCMAVVTITINPLPVIIGNVPICIGNSITLIAGTGTWSTTSSNITIASGTGGTEVVTGITIGTADITFTDGATGCTSTTLITINALPVIMGNYPICVGNSITLSAGTGTWSTTSSNISTTGTGSDLIVTGVTTGTAVITFTVGGCTATAIITINALPVIVGNTPVCLGNSITLSAGTGTWSTTSSNITLASGTGGTEVVTGITVGTADITFTDGGTGCSTTTIITINAMPIIAGNTPICVGNSITLSAGTGTWSTTSSNITTTGTGSNLIVMGVTAGTAIVTYVFGGCNVTAIITINALPIISGNSPICLGNSVTLSAGTGTWSTTSSNITLASGTTIVTEVVTGVAAGTAVVTYTDGITGCDATVVITVNTAPTIIFQGLTKICEGDNTTINVTPGAGTGSFSISGGATIISTTYTSSYSTCVLNGTVAGTSVLTYTVIGGGCTSIGTINITVFPAPSVTVNPLAQVFCSDPVYITANGSGGTGPYVYTWQPTGYVGPTVTVSSVGADIIYTVTCTDANGCKDTATSKIVVACKQICYASCSKRIDLLGYGGTLPGGVVGPGTYYVANNFTITANTAFDRAVVAIKPGVTIFIAPGVVVDIKASHFYCCSDNQMWQGFEMQTAAGVTASMNINGRTLVEDAKIAVNFTNPSITNPTLFKADDCIFNRNWYGLYIVYYPSTATTYPISMTNTVFTSRDFNQFWDPVSNLQYPCAWPDAGNDLKLAYIQPAEVYLPMNIDNPTGMTALGTSGVPYNTIGCKSTIVGGLDALTGIYLEKVGPAASATYTGLWVNGGSKSNINSILFDNMNYGIYAMNSNLLVTGCYFAHMHPHIVGSSITYNGDGIYAIKGISTNNNGLSVNNAGAMLIDDASNYFYNCKTAVEVYHYNYFNGSANNIYSDHKTTYVDMQKGKYGYYIFNGIYTYYKYAVNANYNNILNINTAISFLSRDESLPTSVNILNNIITAAPIDYTLGYTSMGISVNNQATSTTSTPNGTIQINNNLVQLGYNGIYINNFTRYKVYAQDNGISIIPDYFVAPGSMQHGIHYCKSLGTNIVNNNVSGDASSWTLNYMNGFCGESDDKAVVTCNVSSNVYRGFWFMGNPNWHSQWEWNSMNNNRYGMHLDHSVIQSQGTPAAPSDNVWAGTWPPGTVQTMVTAGSTSTFSNLSPLNVRAGIGYDPFPNSAGPFTARYYNGTSLLVTTLPSDPHYCLPIRKTGRTTGGSDSELIEINSPVPNFEYGVTHTDSGINSNGARIDSGYVNYTPEVNWIRQMGIYMAMSTDSSLTDSSAILRQFATMAVNSRYARLTEIENHIIAGDYDGAKSMITGLDAYINTTTDTVTGIVMADGSGANDVVNNYITYFNLFVKVAQDSLSAADSATLTTLAGLCPLTNGTVIYEARALYSQIFNAVPSHNNCMDDTSGARYGQITKGIIAADDPMQNYTLYPNPNNGNIVLTQYILDTEPIQIEVYNAMGCKISNIPLQFNSYTQYVKLSSITPPGLYLLHIINSKNHSFILKFVKE